MPPPGDVAVAGSANSARYNGVYAPALARGGRHAWAAKPQAAGGPELLQDSGGRAMVFFDRDAHDGAGAWRIRTPAKKGYISAPRPVGGPENVAEWMLVRSTGDDAPISRHVTVTAGAPLPALDAAFFVSASAAVGRLHDELPGLRPDEAERRVAAECALTAKIHGDQLIDEAAGECTKATARAAQQAKAHAGLQRRAGAAQAAAARQRALLAERQAEAAAAEARVHALEQELAQARTAALLAQGAAQQAQRDDGAAGAEAARLSADAASAAGAAEQARAASAAADERHAELRTAVDGVARRQAAVEEALQGRWASWERGWEQWGPQDVEVWLRRAAGGRFAAHADEFVAQGVTGAMLAEIPPDELAALGVRNYALRRELRDSIAALAQGAPPEPPHRLRCPITMELFDDPVVIAGDEQGAPYERHAVEKWLRDNNTVPSTNQVLPDEAARALQPLHERRREAREWREQHGR